MQGFHPLRMLLVLLLAATSPLCAEDALLVVMDANSGIESLTQEQVVHIFMGRFRELPNGQAAFPIDQPLDSAAASDFYRLLVDKTPAEIRSYWSRLVFSGKTSPPRKAQSVEQLRQWLRATPGSIGYLRPEELSPELQPVLRLPQ